MDILHKIREGLKKQDFRRWYEHGRFYDFLIGVITPKEIDEDIKNLFEIEEAKEQCDSEIAYLAIYNGEDGRSRDFIVYALWDEKKFDARFKRENNPWLRKEKRIVKRKEILKNLDGLQKLILGID